LFDFPLTVFPIGYRSPAPGHNLARMANKGPHYDGSLYDRRPGTKWVTSVVMTLTASLGQPHRRTTSTHRYSGCDVGTPTIHANFPPSPHSWHSCTISVKNAVFWVTMPRSHL